eukprot:TRINITY_DN12504_c0_g1_i2.p2 TRINITY_DN12504_c0_g1~~TRINITY_DN12504_c0_g1_i2.p2  ORF type:complete len:258 (+),score=29.67 TRINITY_DN12504_c0_g1_i2:55-774(+)
MAGAAAAPQPGASAEGAPTATHTVRVRALHGDNDVFVRALESDTVLDMKKRIAEATGIAVQDQRLLYAGRLMRDDSKLCEHGITDSSVVQLVQRPEIAAAPPAQGYARRVWPPDMSGFAQVPPVAQAVGGLYGPAVQPMAGAPGVSFMAGPLFAPARHAPPGRGSAQEVGSSITAAIARLAAARAGAAAAPPLPRCEPSFHIHIHCGLDELDSVPHRLTRLLGAAAAPSPPASPAEAAG